MANVTVIPAKPKYELMYRGLESKEEDCNMAELYAQVEELQQEMKSLVKQGMKAGHVDEKEHKRIVLRL